MKLRRKIWRYGKRASVLIIVVVAAALLLGGGVFAFFINGGFGPSASSGSVNLSKGLVGWWKMNGNAKDSTPYHDNGAQGSGVAGTTDRYGTSGGALGFNGSGSSSITISSEPQLSPNTFTISLWMRAPSQPPTYETLIQKQCGCGGSNPSYAIYIDASGKIDFGITLNYFSPMQIVSHVSVADGNWHHIVATGNVGSLLSLYIDGSLDSTVADTHSSIDNTIDVHVGYENNGGNHNFFAGSMDDLRIYDRVISAAEVIALYDGYNSQVNAAQGENGLVGWWKLDGNAKDSTPYADDGTKIGSGSWTTDREGKTNGSYQSAGNAGIAIPDASQLNVTQATFSAWFHATSTPGFKGWLAIQASGFNFYLYSDQTICFSGGGKTLCSTTTVVNSKWHQVVATIASNGQLSLYLDGALQGTATAGTFSVNSNEICLGDSDPNCSNGVCPSFPGQIDDLRIYNRILSSGEVANLYNSYNSQISLGGSGQASSISLGKGLVGYWPMNGNAKDATPYSDNGTVNGAIPTTDRKNRANSAYSFNGTSSYINVPLSLPAGSSLTVAAWINPSVLPTTNAGIVSAVSASNFGTLSFFPHKGDDSTIQVGVTTSSWQATNTGSILSPGNWYFVVAWANQATNQYGFYVNGQSQFTSSFVGTLIAATSFNIGLFNYQNAYFPGTIDDVRIYNRALSLAEVQALYDEYQ